MSSFRIRGLPARDFSHLFSMSDAQLDERPYGAGPGNRDNSADELKYVRSRGRGPVTMA